MAKLLKWLLVAGLLAGSAWVGISVRERLRAEDRRVVATRSEAPVPVETAPVVTGSISRRRTLTGSLVSPAEVVVAPKVSGRIVRLAVDVSDAVAEGQEIAVLDDAEFVQAVVQAEADLAVARAHQGEAESALTITLRERERADTLHDRGITAESRRDEVAAGALAAQARVAVAKAQVTRAAAALETAKIRQSYTRVLARWERGDTSRVVSRRHVNEGDTVSANAPLVTLVELDPILAVLFVSERDYGSVRIGQIAAIRADAFPSEEFTGVVERMAPVFLDATRQARVEVRIANPETRLKPGMFVRATLVMATEAEAVLVPEAALSKREGQIGVFAVDLVKSIVRWQPVTLGLEDQGRVQLVAAPPISQVVVLGHQFLSDGARIIVPPPLPSSSKERSGTGDGH